MKLLVIEDEPSLLQSIMEYFIQIDFLCEGVTTYASALQKIDDYTYDCIILDINLPGGSGFKLLKYLREYKKDEGVVIISARNSLDDKIIGLNFGADDYVTKPFSLEELLIRVKLLINKSQKISAKEPVAEKFNFGKNLINFKSLECTTKAGEVVPLTKKEAMLLKLLIENKNEVVTREKILQSVWGYNVYPTTRTVDNFILNFRKYFEEDSRNPKYFHSVRGIGYKFTNENQ